MIEEVVEKGDREPEWHSQEVAAITKTKDKFKRLVEERCLDAIQEALTRHGCVIQSRPDGLFSVTASE